MANFVPFNSFTAKLATGTFDFGDHQLSMTLTAAGDPPTASNSVIGDITPISLTNVDGDMNLTTDSASTVNTNGFQVTVLDKQVAASGGDVGPFRYAVVYDSETGDLISFYDFEDSLTISNGTSMLFDFSQDDGLWRLTFVPA